MIKMMDEIDRYREMIKNGHTSPREVEEMQRMIDIAGKILEWFEDQGNQITKANYDPDTGIMVFDMQNASGLNFKEFQFDILVEDELHPIYFQNWKDGEYRKVQFTHFLDPTDGLSATLQGDSIAFELLEDSSVADGAGQDGSYPVKIPLGNWILKEGKDGDKEIVPLKKFFDESNDEGVTPENLLDMSIDELGLSLRSSNNLKRASCWTVGDIASRTEDEIKSIRNIGQRSFEEIKGHLEALGLSFKEPDESYSVDVSGIVDHIIKALVPEESRLEKARREVQMQCKLAKDGDRPSEEELTAYLKYLGYNAEEIEYALRELEDETGEDKAADH